MPFLEISGARAHYRWDGPSDGPVLLLTNSLGTDLSMWDPQIPELSRHFRLLRYDMRGHGQSSLPAGACTIDQLGTDALALLDALGVERVNFCGLSLGGAVGQWLGIHHPERLNKLVLANTAAKFGTPESWTARIEQVGKGGIQSLLPGALDRWFTADFQAAEPDVMVYIRNMLLATPAEGYIACCEALREIDQRVLLSRISVPTLVVGGAHDAATPAAQGELLASSIPGARFLCLPAAHLANIEASAAFTAAVLAFLLPREEKTAMDEQQRFDTGMKMRRAVLGDEHVDRSLERLTPFNHGFQEFITRYAWGEVWSRPGLSRRVRSLLTLVLMAALNREEEFRMHIHAAFRNGVSREEISEALLHAAIYCGLPAANAAYKWAEQEIEKIDAAEEG